MSEFNHDFGDSVVEEWVYDGRACVITQHPNIGHYCGYARTPLNISHLNTTYSGKEYVKLLNVHGGITYGLNEDGFVGFDCGHSQDVCFDDNGDVCMPTVIRNPEEYNCHWYVEDVKEEVRSLADQLSALEQFVEDN